MKTSKEDYMGMKKYINIPIVRKDGLNELEGHIQG